METIYTNCQIVTRHRIIHGTLVTNDGCIKDIETTRSSERQAIDLEGDLLLPGLIELHTDNLEKNIQPRPGVIWPSILAAALAHDLQIAGAGITTVFDAIAVGGLRESSIRSKIFAESIEALSSGKTANLFKANHFLHLRCEVSDEHMETMLLPQIDNPNIRLISLMDHTPGQRQWSDLSKWKIYHRDKMWTEGEISKILTERKEMQSKYAGPHRRLAIAVASEKNIPLASHDDTTEEDVLNAVEAGVCVAEFPTTIEAAQKAHENGLTTIMGAPNAVRGQSHSGNISTALLAEKYLLDGLSSDYVPTSLLQAVFGLSESLEIPLPETVAMVSANIADVVGFNDRGELQPGKRADMVRVRLHHQMPVIQQVFKKGVQIA